MFMKIISFTAVSLVITALVALGLILSERPKELSNADTEGSLDFASIIALGHSEVPDQLGVEMGDGWNIPVRRYGDKDASKPLLILLHGSGWVGLQFDSLAKNLSKDAHVVVPDLRGHGANPERRGDVDYINQMQDDIAALIDAERLPNQSVILAGHSSGGGLVIRFAGSVHGDKIDHAILLAPFLKHNAPTTRQNSGGWARVMTRRIIGISMLNTFKITGLNHLTIIQFTMPKAVRTGKYGHLATLAYSYRLNTGYAPRADYLKDVAALPKFTLIIGSDDEAFFADKYEEVMSVVTDKGSYNIVAGETHLSIIDAPTTAALIKETLE
ncbi:alpha/beta hydrolase [Sulfitobacter sp.]|uniref:alpha/beta hydrolase n=1 Tax=Sulfitobacter sp. TaxID=1903071 RepID=UPI003F6D881C